MTIQPTDKPVVMRELIDKTRFVLIFGSLGPLAFFAPKGLWLPILLLLLASLKTLTTVTKRDYRRIFRQNALYLTLPAYAVLSAAWAVVPENAAITGAKLFGYFLAAMAVVVVVDRLSDANRRSVFIWAATGLVIADMFVWVDLGTAGALSGLVKQTPFEAEFYSRGAAISACAVLPIAVGLFRLSGLRPALVFAGISMATVLLLANEAAKLAAVLGILAYVVVWWRGIFFWPVVLLPLVVGIMSPMFFANELSNSQLCTIFNSKKSAAHRLFIYQFSSRKIFEKPFLGWGMDSSRSMPGGAKMAEIHDCSYKEGRPTTHKIGEKMPLHPHSAALQVWLELGAVGVAILVGLLGTLILRWQRRFAYGPGRPLIAGLLTSIFLVYSISFGLWQSWLIFALIFLCAIVRALRIGNAETNVAPSG